MSLPQKHVKINIPADSDIAKRNYKRLLKKFQQDNNQVFQLPTLKAVVHEIEGESGFDEKGEPLYHGQRLKYYRRGKQYIADNCVYLLECIIQCYEQRYWFDENTEKNNSSNDHLIFPICKIINAAAWPKLQNEDDDENTLSIQLKSISCVYEQFSKMSIFKDFHEYDIVKSYIEVVRYCQRYFDYEKSNPIELWNKVLIQCEDKPEWRGIALLIEICLCTPCSNATLERFFSQLKIVKTEQRTALSSSSLNSILRIKLRQISARDFHKEFANKIALRWYNSKSRRIHQKDRKSYKKRKSSVKTRNELNVEEFTIDNSSSDSRSSSDDESD